MGNQVSGAGLGKSLIAGLRKIWFCGDRESGVGGWRQGLPTSVHVACRTGLMTSRARAAIPRFRYSTTSRRIY